MTPEEREALIAGYALGSLSDPDARDAERLLRTDDDAAQEYEAYVDLAGMIALSVPLRHADPALRDRVLEVARRSPSPWRARPNWRRFLPAAGLAAALAVVSFWAVSLQSTLSDLRTEQAALAAVVEASAKRIDVLDQTTVDVQQAQSLSVMLETAIRDQQAILAVQADPDADSVALTATGAAHGGGGQYVWSHQHSAGVLIAHRLPPLPIGASYKAWLEDAGGNVVASTGFIPAANGDATVVFTFDSTSSTSSTPTRLFVVASSAGGMDGPVVLRGTLRR